MAIVSTTMTNKVWQEKHHIVFDDNIYGDTAEDSQLFVENMMDAINKARRTVMHVGTYVVLYIKTTHHEWEITVSKHESGNRLFYAVDLENGRDFHATQKYMYQDDYTNQLWVVSTP